MANPIFPAFTRLMDQWLNQVLDVSTELIISYRLAEVSKSIVKEGISEASLTLVKHLQLAGLLTTHLCVIATFAR